MRAIVANGSVTYPKESFVEILTNKLVRYRKDPIPGAREMHNLRRYFLRAMQHIRAVHTPEYVSRLTLACAAREYWSNANIELSPEVLLSVKASVALGLIAMDTRGFAVTAPAGHHACADGAGALCLVNTVAVVAQALLVRKCRVAIIDIDGHHGDGTEAWASGKERVLFASIYQKDSFPFFPYLRYGYDNGGLVRMPILPGSGDDVFLMALDAVLARVREFGADHILVSAGFDGHYEDSVLDLRYSMRGYHEAGRRITSLGIPTSAVLEGGYGRCLSQCIRAFCDGASGIPWTSKEEYTESSRQCARHCEQMLVTMA